MDHPGISWCFNKENRLISRINWRHVRKNGRHTTERELRFPNKGHVETSWKDKRLVFQSDGNPETKERKEGIEKRREVRKISRWVIRTLKLLNWFSYTVDLLLTIEISLVYNYNCIYSISICFLIAFCSSQHIASIYHNIDFCCINIYRYSAAIIMYSFIMMFLKLALAFLCCSTLLFHLAFFCFILYHLIFYFLIMILLSFRDARAV